MLISRAGDDSRPFSGSGVHSNSYGNVEGEMATMKLKTGQISLIPFLDFAANNPELLTGTSPAGVKEAYKELREKALAHVPKNSPGWFLWGTSNSKGGWDSALYVGKSGKKKDMYDCLNSALWDERIAFWSAVLGRDAAIRQGDKKYPSAKTSHRHCALKRDARMLVWVTVDGAITDDEMNRQEDVLVEHYDPPANTTRRKKTGKQPDAALTEKVKEAIAAATRVRDAEIQARTQPDIPIAHGPSTTRATALKTTVHRAVTAVKSTVTKPRATKTTTTVSKPKVTKTTTVTRPKATKVTKPKVVKATVVKTTVVKPKVTRTVTKPKATKTTVTKPKATKVTKPKVVKATVVKTTVVKPKATVTKPKTTVTKPKATKVTKPKVVKATVVKTTVVKPKVTKTVTKPKATKTTVTKPKATKVTKPKVVKATVTKPKATKTTVTKPKAVKTTVVKKTTVTKPAAVKAPVQRPAPEPVRRIQAPAHTERPEWLEREHVTTSSARPPSPQPVKPQTPPVRTQAAPPPQPTRPPVKPPITQPAKTQAAPPQPVKAPIAPPVQRPAQAMPQRRPEEAGRDEKGPLERPKAPMR